MGVSKVDFAGNTLVDLTGDSVTPATLKKGETAHNAAGEQIVGTMEAGGTTPGAPGDITFYDYDGTIVTSWTLEELATKTALPDYPSHDGLICQGWNWSLADLKTAKQKMNVGTMYITDDGKTRIYIHLEEGRTSPMLGCNPNGTVSVDWGDGTTPDTLTGTGSTQYTPNHNYAAPGDYMITLTAVSGTFSFYGSSATNQYSALLRYVSGANAVNVAYLNCIRSVEIGNNVDAILAYAFEYCYSLKTITIPSSVSRIHQNVFNNCYSLQYVCVPNGVEYIDNMAMQNCSSLRAVSIPKSVTSLGQSVFYNCYSLLSVRLTSSVSTIGSSAFESCFALQEVNVPKGLTAFSTNTYYLCRGLTHVKIPGTVTTISNRTFYYCYGMKYYDFTEHTSIPTLSGAQVFSGIPMDCEIRVPLSIVDAWKAATNWSTYADHIVGV